MPQSGISPVTMIMNEHCLITYLTLDSLMCPRINIRFLRFAPTKKKHDFSKYFVGRVNGLGFSINEWGIGSTKSQNKDLHFEHTYGDKLAFWGGVSAQTNLSFGTPQQVKEEVKRRIDVLGRGGGYLIGPNHVIEPEVTWENLIAYFEAVEEYGTYS